MPYAQKWVLNQPMVVQLADAVLRGISQIVFMNNSITGLILFIVMFFSSPYETLCMLLGVCASTLSAYFLGKNHLTIINGIYGYNGGLIGIAICIYHFGGDDDFFAMPQIIPIIIFLSGCTVIFLDGLTSLLFGKFGVCSFTVPFEILTWIWIASAEGRFF